MRGWVPFTAIVAILSVACGAYAGLNAFGWAVLAVFLIGVAVASHDILGDDGL